MSPEELEALNYKYLTCSTCASRAERVHRISYAWSLYNDNFPLFGQVAGGHCELQREVVFQRAFISL